jgi:2-keto-4-pentenoate hydratase/2-oxohepta-3-ene-1,7-dioic acid hydratase in catechol pathway
MKLVTFDNLVSGRTGCLGVLEEAGDVVDLTADPALPTEMRALVAGWGAYAAPVAAARGSAPRVTRSAVRLRAPIRPANNIMCVGKNYVAHAREFAGSGFDASQREAVPQAPVIFTKALSSLADPGAEVEVSADPTGTSDYEGELAVVIGRGGRGLRAQDAWEHVFGYTVVNDVTVREVQRRHVQFFLGKSAATYCPMGPAIVTRDEVPDVTALRVRTTVNGELRQDAPVADLIFDVPTLVETISATVRLEPGDVIATGTPAGVGIGFDPPRYLRPGDTVEVEIPGIGTLTNTCV